MSTRHTPGPYTIQAVPHNNTYREGFHYCVRDTRNCCIAVVGEIDAITDGAEAEANARLIATAPNLLKLLEQAEAIIRQLDRPRVGKFWLPNFLAGARYAIAGVKGERHQCSRCGAWGPIVNACGCDPENLPTRAIHEAKGELRK